MKKVDKKLLKISAKNHFETLILHIEGLLDNYTKFEHINEES